MRERDELRAAIRRLVAGTGESDPGDDDRDERSFREVEVRNWPETKTESLERTLDRAESVLDGQLTTLDDIDDKALRTVRLAVLLLGVVVSIAGIAPESVPVNGWTKSSVVFLVCSIIIGIFTYSTSPPDLGPGPRYVHPNFDAGDANDEVYLKLLHGYDKAISHNRDAVFDSARYLFGVQICLIASIVTGSAGVVFAV